MAVVAPLNNILGSIFGAIGGGIAGAPMIGFYVALATTSSGTPMIGDFPVTAAASGPTAFAHGGGVIGRDAFPHPHGRPEGVRHRNPLPPRRHRWR